MNRTQIAILLLFFNFPVFAHEVPGELSPDQCAAAVIFVNGVKETEPNQVITIAMAAAIAQILNIPTISLLACVYGEGFDNGQN